MQGPKMQKRTNAYGCVSEGDGERAGGSARGGHAQRRPKDAREAEEGETGTGKGRREGGAQPQALPGPDPRPTGGLVHETGGGVV